MPQKNMVMKQAGVLNHNKPNKTVAYLLYMQYQKGNAQ